MALINCPECNKENVSDSATSCPSCGFAIKAYYDEQKKLQAIEKKKAETIELKQKRSSFLKKHLKQIVITIILLIVIGMCLTFITAIKNQIKVTQIVFELEAGEPVDYNKLIRCNKNADVYILSDEINICEVGQHEIIYNIRYKGKTKAFPIKINVKDTSAPTITVISNKIPWMQKNPNLYLCNEDHIVVEDMTDRNPDIKVISGVIDSTKNGTYDIVYYVCDSHGNENNITVTYTVDDGMENVSEDLIPLYASVQGTWTQEENWSTDNVKMTILFEGQNYIYRDSLNREYSGRYFINKSISSTSEDERFLFQIDLKNYRLNPPHLFYYEGTGSLDYGATYITDRFANQDNWFENFAIYEHKGELIKKEPPKYEPQIGMTYDEVLGSSWGSPKSKNITQTEYDTSEQWCYSINRYIYFTNGIVRAIQKTE